MLSKKSSFKRAAARRGWANAAIALGLSAALGVAACGPSTTTGIYALPVSPQTSPNVGQGPQTGPTNVPDRECKGSTGDYRLGAGDRIRVVVLSDTEFSADYEVNSSGTISARMLGSLDVTGKTTQELEQILRDRYTGAGYLRSPRLGDRRRFHAPRLARQDHDPAVLLELRRRGVRHRGYAGRTRRRHSSARTMVLGIRPERQQRRWGRREMPSCLDAYDRTPPVGRLQDGV